MSKTLKKISKNKKIKKTKGKRKTKRLRTIRKKTRRSRRGGDYNNKGLSIASRDEGC
jgi:hypothetical protein